MFCIKRTLLLLALVKYVFYNSFIASFKRCCLPGSDYITLVTRTHDNYLTGWCMNAGSSSNFTRWPPHSDVPGRWSLELDTAEDWVSVATVAGHGSTDGCKASPERQDKEKGGWLLLVVTFFDTHSVVVNAEGKSNLLRKTWFKQRIPVHSVCCTNIAHWQTVLAPIYAWFMLILLLVVSFSLKKMNKNVLYYCIYSWQSHQGRYGPQATHGRSRLLQEAPWGTWCSGRTS